MSDEKVILTKRLAIPHAHTKPRAMVAKEQGIPIPPRKGGSGKPRKYPWHDLAVGESFLLPKSYRCSRGSISQYAWRTGYVFTSRAVPDGVRVWRIA